MSTTARKPASRRNVRKAAAKGKKTIARLPKRGRTARGRQGAKAARRAA